MSWCYHPFLCTEGIEYNYTRLLDDFGSDGVVSHALFKSCQPDDDSFPFQVSRFPPDVLTDLFFTLSYLWCNSVTRIFFFFFLVKVWYKGIEKLFLGRLCVNVTFPIEPRKKKFLLAVQFEMFAFLNDRVIWGFTKVGSVSHDVVCLLL